MDQYSEGCARTRLARGLREDTTCARGAQGHRLVSARSGRLDPFGHGESPEKKTNMHNMTRTAVRLEQARAMKQLGNRDEADSNQIGNTSGNNTRTPYALKEAIRKQIRNAYAIEQQDRKHPTTHYGYVCTHARTAAHAEPSVSCGRGTFACIPWSNQRNGPRNAPWARETCARATCARANTH